MYDQLIILLEMLSMRWAWFATAAGGCLWPMLISSRSYSITTVNSLHSLLLIRATLFSFSYWIFCDSDLVTPYCFITTALEKTEPSWGVKSVGVVRTKVAPDVVHIYIGAVYSSEITILPCITLTVYRTSYEVMLHKHYVVF